MKREELIQQIRKAHNWERARGHHKLADLLGHVLAHLTDPNSITLQLPTYAPGDPKAGEGITIGDHVYSWRSVMEGGLIGPFDHKVYEMHVGYDHSVSLLHGDSADGDWIPDDNGFYSTAASRDAAMKAAEEAAK